jgi:hypothetical protein
MDDNDNSNNGLITKIWGPGLWLGMHSISFGYPKEPTEEQKKNYKEFFILMGNVLPCSYCRDSYKKFISTGNTELTDDVMKNRESLTRWLYNLHEAVNKKLDVDYGVTYDDVVKRYESYRAKCNKDDDQPAKGCMMPLDKKAQCYKVAYNVDCPLVHPGIVRKFLNYARIRGLCDDELALIDKFENSLKMHQKDSDEWCQRNKECRKIITSMRSEGINSLEKEGEWINLPTVEELKLMMRLSSNLSNSELLSLIPKLPHNIQTGGQYNKGKRYRLVKNK